MSWEFVDKKTTLEKIYIFSYVYICVCMCALLIDLSCILRTKSQDEQFCGKMFLKQNDCLMFATITLMISFEKHKLLLSNHKVIIIIIKLL